MGKRLNPQRRLIALIREWDVQAHEETKAANVEHGEGLIRSSINPRVQLSAYKPPREAADMRSSGFIPGALKGKIVDGKFKPNRQTKARFGKS